MSNNPTVRRFRSDMNDLVNKAKYTFHQETLAMADELIGDIKRTIEHQISGHLAASVRKKDVTNSDETKISVLVIAGGHLTTKRSEAGVAFDYALAEEFGTMHEAPHPFFYGTYRLYKANGLEQYRETLAQMIAKNNQQRAGRAAGYYNLGAGVTVGNRFSTVSSEQHWET